MYEPRRTRIHVYVTVSYMNTEVCITYSLYSVYRQAVFKICFSGRNTCHNLVYLHIIGV